MRVRLIVGENDRVPIRVTLISEGEVAVLPDPSGGTFDAAGDFDRLLPLENQLPVHNAPSLAALGRIEAYADVEFSPDDVSRIVADVVALLELARPGAEVRGLMRLRVLAEQCARRPGSVLQVSGD